MTKAVVMTVTRTVMPPVVVAALTGGGQPPFHPFPDQRLGIVSGSTENHLDSRSLEHLNGPWSHTGGDDRIHPLGCKPSRE